MDDALQYATDHQQTDLDSLISLLKIPSVSTQPAHNADTAAAAALVAQQMTDAGLDNVRLIPTGRHPLVYADWLHAGPEKPTVLIYGHYDVQPAEPLDLWSSPPFEPVITDDYIYARGASDDKGQMLIHIKAAAAWLATSGRLPLNVKFLIEGEEESGGESLHTFIPENREILAADTALVSDTAMFAPGQPSLVYGLRGNCYMLIDLTGPTHDLHSGSYGGGINNPLNALGHLIAALKGPDGHIMIPGFYDDVRPLSLQEREMLGSYPLDEATWLAETGAPAPWGEAEYSLAERLGARPTLDVAGIIGGYTGPGGKTVLPSTVHAKITMRLVPDQDPQKIAALFEAFTASVLPPSITATVTALSGSAASLVDPNTPAMQAAASAYEAVFGRAPVYAREGGSIPVIGQFQSDLGLETVLMGFGLPGDHIHSPNERFYLPNYYAGIQTSIRFLQAYAQMETGAA